jgi:pectinesterase inhibitor-like protein
MKSTLVIFLVFIIYFIFPVNASLPSILGNNLIEKTCKQTPYYDLCVKSLISSPRSFNTDVEGLAKIMVHTINARATHTLHRINKLLQHRQDTNMKRALQSCASRYDAIIKEDIPESLQALRLGNYKFAEAGTVDAAFEARLCEKEFRRCKSPLADMNRVVHDVSIVAASIVQTIV